MIGESTQESTMVTNSNPHMIWNEEQPIELIPDTYDMLDNTEEIEQFQNFTAGIATGIDETSMTVQYNESTFDGYNASLSLLDLVH